MDMTLNTIQWYLGSSGVPLDTSKITVVAGAITKWTETQVPEPTVAELATIKTNYEAAYSTAITDFSEYSDFYDNMIDKINGIPNCKELEAYAQKLVTEYFTNMMKDQLKKISTLASLGGNGSLSLSNLRSVISWITKFVNSNLVGPYAKMMALYTITITKQAQVVEAVANKMSELEC